MDAGAIGNLALWGAVAAAGVAGLAWLTGGRSTAMSPAAIVVSLALATAALAALAWCLLTGNFALAYVADTTTRQGGWPYRLAGLWGGNGGSLLLWAWVILAAGWWAARGRPATRLVATLTGGSVLAIAAIAANPFQRLAIPAIDGGGLTPILRYPAMLYHPPLLYAGHAGLAAPFALAVAGLATGRLDRSWLVATRRWTLAAWVLLAVGLVAGAHWSYVELGWGGFWAWDPVENGGLLPLLAATAFIHRARSAVAADPQGSYPPGLAASAALPFCLSLLGATLSRSGAAQSVHAFAQATAVGRGLLAVLAAAVIAVAVLCYRARAPRATPAPSSARDTALLGAVVVLTGMVAAITVGTAFPALVHILTGDRLAVTGRFYAIVLTPLAMIALVLMAVGPAMPTTRPANVDAPGPLPARAASKLRGAQRFGALAAGAAAVGAAAALALGPLGGAAAFALTMAAAQLTQARRMRRTGAVLAHLGVALMLLGVAGSLRGRQSTEVLRPGATTSIGGFSLHYRDITTDQGGGWRRVTVIIDVSRHGRPAGVLRPGLRVFDGATAALPDVALRTSLSRDLIVAVRQVDPASHAAQLQATVRPLVTLVWWGGLLAAIGGAVVLVASSRKGAAGTPLVIPSADVETVSDRVAR